MLNEQIETLFADFKVNGFSVPVTYLFYEGHGEPYVTYLQYDADNSYSGDDELLGYVSYYDFDVYSKGNINTIIDAVKAKLKNAGWTWQPRRDSPDFYEPDTEYYHKTICFAMPIQIVEPTPEPTPTIETTTEGLGGDSEDETQTTQNNNNEEV